MHHSKPVHTTSCWLGRKMHVRMRLLKPLSLGQTAYMLCVRVLVVVWDFHPPLYFFLRLPPANAALVYRTHDCKVRLGYSTEPDRRSRSRYMLRPLLMGCKCGIPRGAEQDQICSLPFVEFTMSHGPIRAAGLSLSVHDWMNGYVSVLCRSVKR